MNDKVVPEHVQQNDKTKCAAILARHGSALHDQVNVGLFFLVNGTYPDSDKLQHTNTNSR